MSKSPTAQAIDVLESRGFLAGVVERRITARIKRDLYGFADVLAINEHHGLTLALQVTSAGNVAARARKCIEEPNVLRCLKAGWMVEVWGFRPKPDRLGRTLRSMILLPPDGDGIRVTSGSCVAADI
ncbi:MAG: hypothetical protein AAGJ46_12050 [Planctomycetota bacterium]